MPLPTMKHPLIVIAFIEPVLPDPVVCAFKECPCVKIIWVVLLWAYYIHYGCVVEASYFFDSVIVLDVDTSLFAMLIIFQTILKFPRVKTHFIILS